MTSGLDLWSCRSKKRGGPGRITIRARFPVVSELQHEELQRWLRRRETAQALALRACIVFRVPRDLATTQWRERGAHAGDTAARGRNQPVLPVRPGSLRHQTHGCKRIGTTALFAALSTATGEVVGKCHGKHRSEEFKKFLAIIGEAVPAGLDIRLSAAQPQHMQDDDDPQLAAAPAEVPPPLHALAHLVDQSSRALVHREYEGVGPSAQALETAIKEYQQA